MTTRDEFQTVIEESGDGRSFLHIEENVHVRELQDVSKTDTPCKTSLFRMSEILQTVAAELQQLARSKTQAEEEAIMWKKKYEQLCAAQVQVRREVIEDIIETSDGEVIKHETIVRLQPTIERLSVPLEGTSSGILLPSESSVARAPLEGIVIKKGLCTQKVLRSKSIPAHKAEYDYRTVLVHDDKPEYGKVSFRLEWGSDSKQYQQEFVTFERGNISSAPCSSKQITLSWESPPHSVCIIIKPNCNSIYGVCKDMIRWLKEEKSMIVYVEPHVRMQLVADDVHFSYLQTWQTEEEICFLHNKIDLIITLGGDGTVLWAASLFKGPVPPLVSFAMGSLGFMTPFQSEQYQECLHSVMKGPAYITLRHRLHCRIMRHTDNYSTGAVMKDEVHIVLNEVTIDRGMSSFLTNLECYCDNIFVTNVQGDGLILSTPSGSTAYSLSAGGSMVHPQVAAILFTPICPHSLSFRPLILPEHVTVRVEVPVNSRGHAWVAFDGRERLQLGSGDCLVCHLSSWPVPTACTEESTNAFLQGVCKGLHWNMRKIQGELHKLNL